MFERSDRMEIETSGARIHLRHGGEGPPFLLLHGNPLTHVSWHCIANRLVRHFHVVCPTCAAMATASAPRIVVRTTSTIPSAPWRSTRSR